MQRKKTLDNTGAFLRCNGESDFFLRLWIRHPWWKSLLVYGNNLFLGAEIGSSKKDTGGCWKCTCLITPILWIAEWNEGHVRVIWGALGKKDTFDTYSVVFGCWNVHLQNSQTDQDIWHTQAANISHPHLWDTQVTPVNKSSSSSRLSGVPCWRVHHWNGVPWVRGRNICSWTMDMSQGRLA